MLFRTNCSSNKIPTQIICCTANVSARPSIDEQAYYEQAIILANVVYALSSTAFAPRALYGFCFQLLQLRAAPVPTALRRLAHPATAVREELSSLIHGRTNQGIQTVPDRVQFVGVAVSQQRGHASAEICAPSGQARSAQYQGRSHEKIYNRDQEENQDGEENSDRHRAAKLHLR